MQRREFLALSAATVTAAGVGASMFAQERGAMYGLIGKLTAVAGKRDEVLAILLEGLADMPGCLSYIVAKDPSDANAIWITEVWDSKESHDASLSLPLVKDAIAKGRPLIAGFSDSVVTAPVGGHAQALPKGR
jgi:quinol monooxygenase YgiN